MISKALPIAVLSFFVLAVPPAWSHGLMFTPLALNAPYAGDQSRGLREDMDDDAHFDNDDELALSQEEIRANQKQGVSLSLGVVLPWQEMNVSYHRVLNERVTLLYGLGGGSFRMTGMHNAREYALETTAQSVSVAWRYYFTELVPLFVQPSLSLGAWQGDISPKGSDPSTDTVAARLDSGFSAAGVIAGLNFGALWILDSHFFIEYSIFRLGKAQIVSSNFSNNYAESKAATRNDLQRLLSWGFANITLGWYF